MFLRYIHHTALKKHIIHTPHCIKKTHHTTPHLIVHTPHFTGKVQLKGTVKRRHRDTDTHTYTHTHDVSRCTAQIHIQVISVCQQHYTSPTTSYIFKSYRPCLQCCRYTAMTCLSICTHRVAKTHRIPYLCRSLSAKVTYI